MGSRDAREGPPDAREDRRAVRRRFREAPSVARRGPRVALFPGPDEPRIYARSKHENLNALRHEDTSRCVRASPFRMDCREKSHRDPKKRPFSPCEDTNPSATHSSRAEKRSGSKVFLASKRCGGPYAPAVGCELSPPRPPSSRRMERSRWEHSFACQYVD